MTAKKSKLRDLLLDAAHVIFGTFIYAIGNYCFTAPNDIAPGGASGIATMLKALFGLPLGVGTLLINLPLLILALVVIGWKFTVRTLVTIATMTFFYDFVLVYFPTYKGDPLLAALYGGVIMGTGLAIIFMRDLTSGGSDIVAKVVQVKRPDMQMGQLLMMFDVVVVLCSGLVFGKVESMMHAGIAIFVYTQVIDIILYRRGRGKVIFVISRKGPEIARRIISECHRGVTILNGRGAYTNVSTNMLVVAMKSRDYFKLKTLAEEEDPVFIIASDCGEICGNGFRPGDTPATILPPLEDDQAQLPIGEQTPTLS